MGGLLFGTKRLPKIEYEKVRKDVEQKLIDNNIQYEIPKYFEDKQDFGDLDVLILNHITNQQIIDIFKPIKINNNGNCFSINYMDFQIDFIKVGKENWETSIQYLSFNDLGNLIGRLAMRRGVRYGDRGLFFKYHSPYFTKEFNISKDIEKICEFLDLDYNQYKKGFTNLKEIFDFIIDSKYFNPWIYDLEDLNKINRDRNKKRKTYEAWLEYIEPLKQKYPQLKFKQDPIAFNFGKTKEELNKYIDDFFPDSNFIQRLKKIKEDEEKVKTTKEKFNGELLMAMYPELKGKELGDFIKGFDDWIKEQYGVSKNEWVYKEPKEVIDQKIQEFYNLKYGKTEKFKYLKSFDSYSANLEN
jgi:hypothetical protein